VKTPVYLDYHATTPADPRVVEAMLPYFTERFGNPASRNHPFGWAAADAVETARGEVAALVGAHAREIVFTSGATESNNMAIRGVARARGARGGHIVTVATEHPSVVDTCRALEVDGFAVTVLPVEADGLVDLDRVEASLRPDTILVSVMAANNEIGVLQDLEAIGTMTRARGILLHTDASQAAGKVPFDVERAHVSLASLTAHKMYGPKGIGVLYLRRHAVDLPPLLVGGGQERGLRSGTLNVPAIVGFGRAAAIARAEGTAEAARLGVLRDRLLAGLRAGVPGMRVNGSLTRRLPHNLNVSIDGIEPESLAMALGDLAVSAGAACGTGKPTPSRVLIAIGVSPELALASIRFGLGRWTTDEEIGFATAKVVEVVAGLRRLHAALPRAT
jgi:cysteine desulfurase